MKTKKIVILGILIVTIVMCMQTIAITNLHTTHHSIQKTLELTKIERPIKIGGPLEIQSQSIDQSSFLTPPKPASAMGTDILVGGLPELIRQENLHKPRDVRRLTDLLEKMLVDTAWRHECSCTSFSRSKQFCSSILDERRRTFWEDFIETIPRPS